MDWKSPPTALIETQAIEAGKVGKTLAERAGEATPGAYVYLLRKTCIMASAWA
jgi:hypothetical protein